MDDELWGRRGLPGLPGVVLWDAVPSSPAELTAHRAQLRTLLVDGLAAEGRCADDLDRLLLAFEELGSNGLRHGEPPVRVTVTATSTGWVLDVTDDAGDAPPLPAVGRDAADGGLGLYLIARLASDHGWEPVAGRKHVWACIECDEDVPSATG
jgi:hypothetical protein